MSLLGSGARQAEDACRRRTRLTVVVAGLPWGSAPAEPRTSDEPNLMRDHDLDSPGGRFCTVGTARIVRTTTPPESARELREPEAVGSDAQRRFVWLGLTRRRPVPVAPRDPWTSAPTPLVVRDEGLTESVRRLGRIPPRGTARALRVSVQRFNAERVDAGCVRRAADRGRSTAHVLRREHAGARAAAR